MTWLVSYTLASMVAAFVAVRIFDYFVATSILGNLARLGLFVGTWVAVTTVSGLRSFSRGVRQLRQMVTRG